MGIVSYGEVVTHRVNLSQFDNRESLLRKVRDLPQDTGIKTMTASGIETARYLDQNPSLLIGIRCGRLYVISGVYECVG